MTNNPEAEGGGKPTQQAAMAKLQALAINNQRAEHALMDLMTDSPHEPPQAAKEAAEVEEVAATDKKRAEPLSELTAPTKSRTTDEPIEAVTMFDTGEKKAHNCHKCWSEFAGRVPCCPNCQSELREMLTVNMVSIQRAGYVVAQGADQVEVTYSARAAMSEGENLAQMRGAPVFVQLKDLLALNQPRRAGYATARSGPAYGRR
jgi:hypothetical protein